MLLGLPKGVVEGGLSVNEVTVRPFVYHTPTLNNEDLIRIHHGGEAMGYPKGRPVHGCFS
jgi:hypothetical protein